MNIKIEIMKIELIKETLRLEGGRVRYSININGRYLDNSVTLSRKDAEANYHALVANNGEPVKTEILESTEL